MNRPFPPPRTPAGAFGRSLAAAVLVALVVGATHALRFNPPTSALVLQLAVLLLAAWLGTVPGVVAALAATAGMPFLLPPTGSWRVADPANWVALASFLVVSSVAARLVTRAREQAAAARLREQELATLYELSVGLFTAVELPFSQRALGMALRALEAAGGGFVLFGAELEREERIWSGADDARSTAVARRARRASAPLELSTATRRDVYLPQERDERGEARRVFAVLGTGASLGAVESVGALAALALDHERMLLEAAHVEALRESDEVKTSLLRAISHDLATPFTALALELEALQREAADDGRLAARLAGLRRDAALLRRRIENLLAMARIEAGSYAPRPEPVPPADLFRSVRDHLAPVSGGRPIEVSVAADCPDLWVDPSLALEILVNLVDNAHRASPEGLAVELAAAPRDGGARLSIEVRDRGAGLGASGRALGEVRLADLPARGLGLEICRAFTRASAGELTLVTRPGGGTVARLELPAAPAGVAAG